MDGETGPKGGSGTGRAWACAARPCTTRSPARPRTPGSSIVNERADQPTFDEQGRPGRLPARPVPGRRRRPALTDPPPARPGPAQPGRAPMGVAPALPRGAVDGSGRGALARARSRRAQRGVRDARQRRSGRGGGAVRAARVVRRPSEPRSRCCATGWARARFGSTLGAGPLRQRSRRRVAGRVLLVGRRGRVRRRLDRRGHRGGAGLGRGPDRVRRVRAGRGLRTAVAAGVAAVPRADERAALVPAPAPAWPGPSSPRPPRCPRLFRVAVDQLAR